MGKRYLITLIGLGVMGCSPSLHMVYKDGPVKVYDTNRQECELTYTSWDGRVWTDYYGPPCEIFVQEPLRPIYTEENRKNLKLRSR